MKDNRNAQRKTLGAGPRTNNKPKPLMMPTQQFLPTRATALGDECSRRVTALTRFFPFNNIGCYWGRKIGEPEEKTSEQGQHDAGTGNRTRATLVGG